MKSRQVPFFLYWRVENVKFWANSIGHLGWLHCIPNFPRFLKNVNSLELWKYISENSSPKGFFGAIKENLNFPSCRGILDIYRQWLLNAPCSNDFFMTFWKLICSHTVTPRWLVNAKEFIQSGWSKQRDYCSLAHEISAAVAGHFESCISQKLFGS